MNRNNEKRHICYQCSLLFDCVSIAPNVLYVFTRFADLHSKDGRAPNNGRLTYFCTWFWQAME